MNPPGKGRNRLIFTLLVGTAHLVAFWIVRNWSVYRPARAISEDFASIVFFVPEEGRLPPDRKLKLSPRPKVPVTVDQVHTPAPLPESAAIGSTAITQPALPPAVDWRQEIEGAATDVMENARRDARWAHALARKIEPSPSMMPLHEPHRDYGWYAQHSHEVINAHGVPEWVLTQPCAAVILKVDPNCTVDHVEQHGVMFEYMQQKTDEALRYDGPNAVP
jgi:hypothetical protein